MRISLSDDLYWRLVRLAADQELRYDALLEKWIRDADSHREQRGLCGGCYEEKRRAIGQTA